MKIRQRTEMRNKIETRNGKFLPALVLSLIAFSALFGASPLISLEQEKNREEISHDIAVSAISIAVTVQDKKGKFVKDLNKEVFRVYENGANKKNGNPFWYI